MNGFLFAILLPLLLLSITPGPDEVLANKVKCYMSGVVAEYVKECEGKDIVCFSVVKKDNENTAIYKNCRERNEAKSDCEATAKAFDAKCKEPCGTDLCNNEYHEYDRRY